MPRYVGALDQGTTSTRFMIFDRGGNEIARHQLEHEQIMPKPGWVEHDPLEIAARADETIARAPAFRRRPISPRRRSSGFSTTCPACVTRRTAVKRSSAIPTRG